MNIKQRVKIISEITGISLTSVAKGMGISQSTLSNRLKTGKFTKQELNRMAEIMGCKYISCFKFNNGSVVSASSMGEEIKGACGCAGLSAAALGRKIGMTQTNISKRLATGKFKQEELENIAKVLGCKYESKFELNGVIV